MGQMLSSVTVVGHQHPQDFLWLPVAAGANGSQVFGGDIGCQVVEQGVGGVEPADEFIRRVGLAQELRIAVPVGWRAASSVYRRTALGTAWPSAVLSKITQRMAPDGSIEAAS